MSDGNHLYAGRNIGPNNAVEYFVSYYDYYQPEAYIPHTDTFSWSPEGVYSDTT